MRSRILIGLIMGTIGGFLGWLLQENLIHAAGGYRVEQDLLNGSVHAVQLEAKHIWIFCWCVGGLIGMFLGAVEGIIESNSRKIAIGMFFGFLTGGILGFMGYEFGGALFKLLGGSDYTGRDEGIFAFAKQVIARSFGWCLLGLGMGVGAALPTRSAARIRNGAIGGFLGGFLGGFIFEMVGPMSNQMQGAVGGAGARGSGRAGTRDWPHRHWWPDRILYRIEEWLKQAWVKVLAGRNEGKDFILSKPVNILGRDERSDVPLFGDNTVGVQHAAIRTDGYRHHLMDAGSPSGTLVNGQPVGQGGELLLRDGDMIQIGSHRILFREKATQNRVAPSPVDAPRARAAGPAGTPMPGHLCPFCGGTKDAAGNCLCTPAAGNNGQWSGASGQNAQYSPVGGFENLNGQPVDYASGQPNTQYPTPNTFAQPAGRLIGLEGATAGQVFAIMGPNMTLGREVGRDIVVQGDTTVSRTHARLGNENGVFMVYDNNSANGTFVNGVRVQMQALAPGDVVQFGNSKFRFE